MDPFVTGGLIKAGAGLLGGLFNRGAQRRANERNRPVNQVKEWEAAGINPLFGLTSGAYIPHQANTAIGDAFGKAGGIFGETLQASKEQNLRETQIELENELLKKELDKLAKPIEPGHLKSHVENFGVFPTGDSPNPVPVGGGDDNSPVLGINPGNLAGETTVTSPYSAGEGTYVDPRMPDAEADTTRYGEAFETTRYVIKKARDHSYNKKMQKLVRQSGREFANRVHVEYAKADGRDLNQVIYDLRTYRPDYEDSIRNEYDNPKDDISGGGQMIIPAPPPISSEWLPTKIQ